MRDSPDAADAVRSFGLAEPPVSRADAERLEHDIVDAMVNIPELIAGLILDGMGAWILRSTRWGREKEARAQAWEDAVRIRLGELRRGRFLRPADAAAAGVALDEDETAYGIFVCDRCVPKTVTRNVLHCGPGGPDVRCVTDVVLANKGLGLLVVTNERIVFHELGKGAIWSREWGSVNRWNASGDQIVIEPTDGDTQIFDISMSRCLGAGFVDGDIRCVGFILQKAAGSAR